MDFTYDDDEDDDDKTRINPRGDLETPIVTTFMKWNTMKKDTLAARNLRNSSSTSSTQATGEKRKKSEKTVPISGFNTSPHIYLT